MSAVAAEFETIQQPDAAASAGIDRQTAANALLKLLSPEARKQPSVAAKELSSGAGVGLVATRDVRPGALLLTVPFSLVLETAGNQARQRKCQYFSYVAHAMMWATRPKWSPG